MEIKYQKKSKKLVIKRLGLLAYFNYSGGINRGLNSGYDYCKNILLHQKVESDESLKFHILMQLYKCSIFDEKYGRAVDYLQMALEIKPSDFLVSYWMAETNELIGNAEKAISIYQNIVTNCSCISDSLKEYINIQIERVKTTGPKTPSPMPGLKYMSY